MALQQHPMKSLLRGPGARSHTEAAWGFAKAIQRSISGGPTTTGPTTGIKDGLISSQGPSVQSSQRAARGPSGGIGAADAGGRADVDEEHLSFAQSFEEAPIPLDEFGSLSYRPAVKVDISSTKRPPTASGRNFGKPRFNVKGLDQHESLYQPSLWQQLLKQEIDRRKQRQARTARRTAQVLGASAASAATRSKTLQGASSNEPALEEITESPDGRISTTWGERGSPKGPWNGGVEAAEQASPPERPHDWRDLSDLQQTYEVNTKIRSVEVSANTLQQSLDVAPTPSEPNSQDAALDAIGLQLGGEEEVNEKHHEGALPLHGSSAKGIQKTEEAEMIETEGPIARATHMAGMPRALWERLAPQHLHTQQRLLRARTVDDILAAVGAALEIVGGGSAEVSEIPSSTGAEQQGAATDTIAAAAAHAAARHRLSLQFGMDPVNAVTAVHRLGKLTTPYQRGALLGDGRFVSLMGAGKAALPLIDSQGASNMLWGLTRLEHAPEWLPQLLSRCASLTSQMTPHQVATCLYCLSRLPLLLAESRVLQRALVEAAVTATPQLQRPLDLTCICAALARLKVKDPRLFGGLAGRARQLLPQLSMSELASVAWAFAAVGLVDRGLFAAVQRRVEADAELCSPGDVVQLAWALARAGEEKRDLFDYTITPILRGCLPQLNARQLATVASSYAQAGKPPRPVWGTGCRGCPPIFWLK